jgi:hypothetical protein
VQAHKGIINTIDGIGGQGYGYGAPELLTGGRDGNYTFFYYLMDQFNLFIQNHNKKRSKTIQS